MENPLEGSALKAEKLGAVAARVAACTNCRLCERRTHAVPGEGSPDARVLFVGEGPGHDEDIQGRPFVGPAGQLLDKMLAAIGLKREEVYIANVVKCRPPNNRDPEEDEQLACIPYLRAQFSVIRPEIIVCLGRIAAKRLIDPAFRITVDHGKWYERNGVLMTATYHPSALLRDPGKKREAWEDLKSLAEHLNKTGLK